MTRGAWRLPASACRPAHPSGRRYLRWWELGATTGTSRWTTCTCRTEPAPSQVRDHTIGALWTGQGGQSTPWGHTAVGMGTAHPFHLPWLPGTLLLP